MNEYDDTNTVQIGPHCVATDLLDADPYAVALLIPGYEKQVADLFVERRGERLTEIEAFLEGFEEQR